MPELARPDGTRIHYEIRGTGPPVLMLAPGVVNSDITAWDGAFPGLIDAIATTHTAILMDQRYAGESTGPGVPFSYEAMTEDQLAVLDAAAGEPAVVAGAGIGANYALRLACLAPERVCGAIVAMPLGRPPGGSRSPAYRLFEETFRTARMGGIQGVIDAARAEPRFDRNPAAGPYGMRLANDAEFVAEAVRKGRERYVVRVVRFRDAMFPDDAPFFSVSEEQLRGCRVPMLVVPGDSDLAPRATGSAIAELAPGGTLLAAELDAIAIFENGLERLRQKEEV